MTLRAAARRCGGARSPTRGSMSWGVTVVMAVMKEMAVKVLRSEVRQRPSLAVLLLELVLLRGGNVGGAILPECCCEEDQATYEWTARK